MTTDDPLNPACVEHEDDYADLIGQRIYGLVYYGRREYVEVLNPYLERNLRKNGGVLDRVLFALVKYTHDDLIYLGHLQRRNPHEFIVPPIEGGGWDCIWRLASERGAIYVKIDDDIMYIADGTFADLAREKLRNRFLFVSANVVNHGILSAVHQELAQIRWVNAPREEPPPPPTEEAGKDGDGSAPAAPRNLAPWNFHVRCSRTRSSGSSTPSTPTASGGAGTARRWCTRPS